MLDEAEDAEVAAATVKAMRSLSARAEREGRDVSGAEKRDALQAGRDAHARLTGRRDADAHAVRRHVLARYGPPCAACGKPLRTPQARACMECGLAVEGEPPAY